MYTRSIVVAIVLVVLNVVCMWILFTKAGEKGWKAIIPFYNTYIAYKLFWKKAMFWVTLVLTLVALVCSYSVFFRHLGNTMSIYYTAANEMGVSVEDLMNGNLNMTDEEIQQAAQDYVDKMDADIQNGVDNPVVDSLATAIENFTVVDFILMVLCFIAYIVLFVLGIIYYYNFSKSFGHGAGYTVGLIFLPTIFMLILAFGKSQYTKQQQA